MRRRACFLLGFFLVLAPLRGSLRAADTPRAHDVCWSCHGSREEASFGTAGVGAVPCLNCHADVAGTPRPGSTHTIVLIPDHPALLGGEGVDSIDCLSCHDPHAAGERAYLRPGSASLSPARYDRITRVCATCHPKSVESDWRGPGDHAVRHPVGIPPQRDWRATRSPVFLPLAVTETGSGPEPGVIGCTTCHFVHASENAFLLRWSRDQERGVCTACHTDLDPDVPPARAVPVVAR